MTSRCAVLAMFVMLTSSALADDVLTKEQLANGVARARAALVGLQVDSTLTMVEGPHAAVRYDYKRIWLDGRRIRVEHTYGNPPDDGGRRGFTAATVDGAVAVTYWNPSRTAAVTRNFAHRQLQLERHLDLNVGFFEFLRYTPDFGQPDHARASDLLVFLRSEGARVRPELEAVDDHLCHVVDVHVQNGDRPSMTFWIDTERGFVPLRQRFYANEECADGICRPSDEVALELEVERLHQAAPELWLPVVARRSAFVIGAEYLMQVDGWDAEDPAIEINLQLEENLFDYRRDLPNGTLLNDLDTGEIVVIGDSA